MSCRSAGRQFRPRPSQRNERFHLEAVLNVVIANLHWLSTCQLLAIAPQNCSRRSPCWAHKNFGQMGVGKVSSPFELGPEAPHSSPTSHTSSAHPLCLEPPITTKTPLREDDEDVASQNSSQTGNVNHLANRPKRYDTNLPNRTKFTVEGFN